MLTEEKIIISPRAAAKISGGYPWVFSNEIVTPLRELPDLCLGALSSPKGDFLGKALFHKHSLIALRLLTHGSSFSPEIFFYERMKSALKRREDLYPGWNVLRLVYGESDGLPGLVADRYGDYLILEINAKALLPYEEPIVQALNELLSPKGILLKNTASVLSREGITPETRLLSGTVPEETVVEEGAVRFLIRPYSGQKTSLFLDQKENRRQFSAYTAGRGFTDLFCYAGAWGLYALKAGAASALFVDISDDAGDLVRENLKLNGWTGRGTFIKADIFQYIKEIPLLDTVSLDPPAFAKSKKDLPSALKGYLYLNRAVMKKMAPGGLLATSSCSYHVSALQFDEMLMKSAMESRSRMTSLPGGVQAPDHPVLIQFPESLYLKTRFLKKDNL